MIDTHCHVDLYPRPTEVASEARRAGVLTVVVTNLPSAFDRAQPHVQQFTNLRLALGEARAAALSFDMENQFQVVRTVFGGQTRAEVMTALVAHSYDHYGQMVVYARLSGVTPPVPGPLPAQ